MTKSMLRFSALLLSVLILSFQNCSQVAFEEMDLSSQGVSPSGPNVCNFNGQPYSEGSVVRAYLTSTVLSGQSCQYEDRVCSGGAFTGSYQYSSCSPNGGAAACLFNGRTIVSGTSVKAYLNSSVAFGLTCVSQDRVCTNGVLSGSYNYENCNVGSAAGCLFNGQTVPHGGSVKAYVSSTVSAGSVCQEVTRVCNNGSLSGSGNYASCSVSTSASCLFNGQTIPHGGTVSAYATSSVSYGQTCAREDRYCNNGSLSGSYIYSSCVAQSAGSCYFNGQTLYHGQSVTAYATASVAYGNTCSSQTRTCNNGSLSGSYSYSTCSAGSAASCSFNGQSIAHGGSVTAYASSSVGYGQSCQSEQRQCWNGSLTGSYGASSCAASGPASCSFGGGRLTWGAAGCAVDAPALTVPHGGTRSFSSSSSTGSGNITYACNNGAFSVASETCTPKRCETFTGPPKCTEYVYCENGSIVSAQTVYPTATISMSAAIGETVGTVASQVRIHDSALSLIRWDNLQFRCNENGWQQVNDGYCVVRRTIPASDTRCQYYDGGGGG